MVTITVRPFLLTFLTLCMTIAAARASRPVYIMPVTFKMGVCPYNKWRAWMWWALEAAASF